MKTYDPAQVLTSFAGQIISGFGEGTMIVVERDEAAFTKKVGADGEVARARNRNRSGKVRLTLMQSSASNDYLSSMARQDELAGTGVGVLQIKDGLGTTLVMVPNAWIEKIPNTEFGKEQSDREWVFDCDFVDATIGGLVG